jgi:hypothetical protein
VGTVKVTGGLRTTRLLRWYPRAQLLGWIIIGNTALYLGSIVVGLWVIDGASLVAENAVYMLGVFVLHLPLLWLSVRIVRRARSLTTGDAAAVSRGSVQKEMNAVSTADFGCRRP